MDFVDFDPERHEGRKLYELRSREVGDALVTEAVPSEIPFERAKETPWYFVVEAE